MPNPDNLHQNTSDSLIVNFRKSIDKIDDKLLELINKRLLLAIKIGKAKEQNSTKVVDSARENEIMQRLFNQNKGPINNSVLQHIFTEIIATSRNLQKPQIVTYLGPEATFTHIASMNHFGHSVSFIPQFSIHDVFNEVEKGAFNYGVVPVENSIEGSVNHTLDLFFESDLKICAEIHHNISHDLLSINGSLDNIKVIYSHPHAFAQCRKWLRKYLPGTELTECSSTSFAAEKAAKDNKSAAIASREAADMYNLQVVAPRIEDNSRNITRFLVIGQDEIHRTGKDRTSIMFATTHSPGALQNALKPIAEAKINMVKLESRPSKHENWNYFFFVDLEGHIEDLVVNQTISKMKGLCMFLKSLGSYPMTNGK